MAEQTCLPPGVPGCSRAAAARPGTSGGAGARPACGRLRAIWITGAILFALLTAFRLGLLLSRRGQLAGASHEEIAHCFLLGLRYDAMPVGYMLLPLVLALTLLPARVLRRPRTRKALVLYAAAAVTVALLTSAVGAFFFTRFGRRLNYMAFAYLTHRETLEFIWRHYPAWLVPPGAALVFVGFCRLFQRWFWRGTGAGWPIRRRALAAGALLAMCILACRGGLERRALARGRAYFSANQLVNQLTMNDFFTVFHAAKSRLTDGRDERRLYRLPSADAAAAETVTMFCQDGDVPLDHPANPLWRRGHSPRPRRHYNVVLIVMEGMASRPVGALGYHPSHTPQLDALCAEGLFFDRMYAVGARTSRGIVATLCGHPDLGGTTVLKRRSAQGRFLTLPGILRERGYRTLFVYGGRSEFDNMGRFFAAGGVEEIVDQDEMTGRPGNWGVPDEDIFLCAHERFLAMDGEPFFAVVLTVSNHDPFDVPAGRVELLPTDANDHNKVLNAYRYADWALGEFFRLARSAPYFENTIFVLVSDHGRDLDQPDLLDVPGYRVPCLLYAPGILAPGRIDTVASQTDIPPTLLALLGGDYEHCFFGRDLLTARPDSGFALMHEDVQLAFVRGETAIAMPAGPNGRALLFRVGPFDMTPVPPDQADPNEAKSLERQMLSYYKMARYLYVKGAYCGPERYAAASRPTTRSRPAPR